MWKFSEDKLSKQGKLLNFLGASDCFARGGPEFLPVGLLILVLELLENFLLSMPTRAQKGQDTVLDKGISMRRAGGVDLLCLPCFKNIISSAFLEVPE